MKHGTRPKLRQVLPVAVLLVCLLSVIAWPFLGAVALLPPAAYLLICFAWGAGLAARSRIPTLLLAGPAAVIMHMSWAVGFLGRILDIKATRLPRLRNGEA